jgi:hypothetical protein
MVFGGVCFPVKFGSDGMVRDDTMRRGFIVPLPLGLNSIVHSLSSHAIHKNQK